jgi:hypothetical protein
LEPYCDLEIIDLAGFIHGFCYAYFLGHFHLL